MAKLLFVLCASYSYLVALSLVGDDNPVGGAQTQPGGSAQPQVLPSQGPQGPTEQSTQSDQEWSE